MGIINYNNKWGLFAKNDNLYMLMAFQIKGHIKIKKTLTNFQGVLSVLSNAAGIE